MSALSIAEVLEKAADKLSEPGAWMQQAYGLDVDGHPVVSIYEVDGRSCCHCAMGAIAHFAGPDRMYAVADVLARASDLIPDGCDVPVWNDDPARTQSEVVDTFREAAALARGEGR